jgi:thymidylate synthase ThyX
MDFIFQTYADLIAPLKKHLESQKPIAEAEYDINGDGVKEKFAELKDEKQIKAFKQTYTFDLRAKACDILRSLLPIASLTNVGLFGNGRFYQGLITYLLTSDLPENHSVAKGASEALKEIIPQYIRRAKRLDYNASARGSMFRLAKELFSNVKADVTASLPDFQLMDRGEKFLEYAIGDKKMPAGEALQKVSDVHMLAAMVYPYTNLSLGRVREVIFSASPEQRKSIARTYLNNRQTRRDRPGRALEDGYPYTFDLITNFGVYKDLQRHRMNSQQRQLFTTKLGFYYAPELAEIKAMDKVRECVEKSDKLFGAMEKHNPLLAQYAVLHGSYVRWSIAFNDREAMHLLELRSTPQGHPNYRQAAQKMHKLIAERSKWRSEMMQFVDHNDYYWSRADSEAKQRVKEAGLDEKFKK